VLWCIRERRRSIHWPAGGEEKQSIADTEGTGRAEKQTRQSSATECQAVEGSATSGRE